MDIMESIEVIKLYNRNIKRSQSFLYNVLDTYKHGDDILQPFLKKANKQIEFSESF